MDDSEILTKRAADVRRRIPDCYFEIPIDILSNTTKDKLKLLDCSFLLPDNSVKLRDYRGLAILVGYSTIDYNYLIDQKKYQSPTFLILNRMKAEKKSLGDLIDYILQLKRSDILANMKEDCNRDVLAYLNSRDTNGNLLANFNAVKEITSNSEIDEAKQALGKLFTTDIMKSNHRRIDVYDIFISFDSESIPDIKVMISLSECLENSGMTVAKGSYSFFQGCCLIEAFANAIYNRSRKVILLISQTYVNSEICLMQLNFAKDADRAAWRNKVIPVYIENVKKPDCIANLNCFRYYDDFIRQNFFDDFINNVKIS